MIVDMALIPDSTVIPGSSGSLQMVGHTLIDVPLANVYLDSPYYKGHCKVMCVSFTHTAQIKKNDNPATQDVKVQEGTTERKCIAAPVLTRA